MRMRLVGRGGAVGVAVVGVLLGGAAPASAAPGDASAYVADVNVSLLGQSPIDVGPFAPSNADGPTSASILEIDVPLVMSAGVSTSAASLDEATGIASAQAEVTEFQSLLSVLSGSIGAVQTTCTATQSGIAGTTTLVDVAIPGVNVGSNPAPNTTVNILGVGRIIFNEQIANPDGSLTVNGAHFILNAVVATGDLILAQSRCGPAAAPVPLASGAGLWLGLGLLVVIAVPVGAVAIRNRHTATA